MRTSEQHALAASTLHELRAALDAGATPSAALGAAARPGDALSAVARQVALGQPLAAAAAQVATGDAAADLLVRSLAVAERTGAGATVAVTQALEALRADAALKRAVRVRTAQARGTTALLLALPVVSWLLLVALDRDALRFYTTSVGLVTAGVAAALASGGALWTRRLVAAATQAPVVADPLLPRPAARPARAAAVAVPVLVVVTVAADLVLGVVAASAIAAVTGRRPRAAPLASAGGAAEAVELLSVALAAGLPVSAAVATVAPLVPPLARPAFAVAARRLAAGWGVEQAFSASGLDAVGSVLAAGERWGAASSDALRALAEDLRADRRAAAEEAAERLQLALIFPTTLLTLPAFVVGVVPPLLWTAFAA